MNGTNESIKNQSIINLDDEQKNVQVINNTLNPHGEEAMRVCLLKYDDLTPIIDDREKLAAGLKEVSGYRVEIEKTRALVVKKIMSVKKQLNDQAETLKGMFLPVEEKIREAIETIDDRERKEEEARKLAQFQRFDKRTKALFAAGFAFDGINYFVGSFIVSPDDVEDMEDLAFEDAVTKGRGIRVQVDELLRKAEQAEKEAAIAAVTEQVQQPKEVAIQEMPPFAKPVEEIPDSPFDIDTSFLVPFSHQEKGRTNEKEDYVPAGYSLGFSNAKHAILEYINTESPLKKNGLIDFIKNLKP